MAGQDVGAAVGLHRGVRGAPSRDEGDLGRAPVGSSGTAQDIDNSRDHLPLDEADDRTPVEARYVASHTSVDAFKADVDLDGAVFPVDVVGQGLDAGMSSGKRTERSRAAREEAELHDVQFTA